MQHKALPLFMSGAKNERIPYFYLSFMKRDSEISVKSDILGILWID